MTVNYQTASAIDGWPELAPPLDRTRGIGISAALSGMAATALLRARRLLEAFNGPRREPPYGGGGPQTPPEDQPQYDSIWDDPALWMLMMH
jgi:hypothetical protein